MQNGPGNIVADTATPTPASEWNAGTVTALGSGLTLTSGTLTASGSGGAGTTAGGISAAGSTQGTATAVTANYNTVTAGGADTGVVLVGLSTPIQLVKNDTATNKNVYPASGSQIEALGSNVAFAIAPGAAVTFFYTSDTQAYASYSEFS